MNLTEYASFDAMGLADCVKKGDVTPTELTACAVEAIQKINPDVNAVIEVYPDRTESFDELTLGDGPFHGVPFLIKDIGAPEKGRKREAGSHYLEGRTDSEDSFLIHLMKKSGFNNLGRTNVPEFAIAGTTENELYGNTSTPWRKGYSAGGSSGGAAAAVSAGIVPIAHGSDIGGSIRIPASLCGGVGLFPSRGRVSFGPQRGDAGNGMAQNFVQTRSIRDTALALDCLSVPQPGDPFVIKQPEQSFIKTIEHEPKPLRIAYRTDALSSTPVNREVAAAVEQTAHTLEELGHIVEEASPKYNSEEAVRAHMALWFFGYDKTLEALGEPLGRTPSPDNLMPVTWQIYQAAREMEPARYLEADHIINRLRRDVGHFFETYDLWLTPTTANVSEPWGRYDQGGQYDSALDWYRHSDQPIQFACFYNLMGFPAISLPLAMTQDNLPIGIQLGTRHAEEDLLLKVAAQLEKVMPWADRVPPLHVGNRKRV